MRLAFGRLDLKRSTLPKRARALPLGGTTLISCRSQPAAMMMT